MKAAKDGTKPEQISSTAWLAWFVPLVVVLLTAIAFLPALGNGFVNWDDDKALLENPFYRGLGWTQLHWMFTTFYMGHYQPLSWVTLGLDYLVWGMKPFGYHLTSLILHNANAVLFYFVALQLLSAAFRESRVSGESALRLSAGFAALLFALHPLRVESVAWATERRDVVSGLFFLVSLLFYLRATAYTQARKRTRWMTTAVVFYGLSLLSKAIGLMLPIVFLVLDVYPLRRLERGTGQWFGPKARQILREKIPFFSLALAAGVIAPLAQRGVMRSFEEYAVILRASQALFGLAFYLYRTVIPLGLSPLYELPIHFDPWNWRFMLSGFVVIAISISLFVARHRWPFGLASWMCYVAILFPVLGLAQSGPQFAADRYTYLSCLGWALLGGAALWYYWDIWSTGKTRSRAIVFAAGTAIVIVLGNLTSRQVGVWHDSNALWRHVIAVTENSYFKSSYAHSNLGAIMADRGEVDKAIQHYREALRINPVYSVAHNNLAYALLTRRELDNAMAHFRAAIEIDPGIAAAHTGLGEVLVQRNNVDAAIEQFRQALSLEPAYPDAEYQLGSALARKGELEEAVIHFRRALRFQPDYAEAHESLSQALAQLSKRNAAVQKHEEAMRIR